MFQSQTLRSRRLQCGLKRVKLHHPTTSHARPRPRLPRKVGTGRRSGPHANGLHSFIFRLNVSTFYDIYADPVGVQIDVGLGILELQTVNPKWD
jgi:hypothetical protein